MNVHWTFIFDDKAGVDVIKFYFYYNILTIDGHEVKINLVVKLTKDYLIFIIVPIRRLALTTIYDRCN